MHEMTPHNNHAGENISASNRYVSKMLRQLLVIAYRKLDMLGNDDTCLEEVRKCLVGRPDWNGYGN